jgi:exportin-T
VFETVVSTIEHFTKDVTDFPTAKLSFQVLTHMVTTWGGPDIPASGTVVLNGDTQPTQPGLPGFDRFIMERFSPLCWALPSNSTFNPKDAQGRLVLAEAAGLQKAIYTKNGEEYLNWLRDVELRGMGMDDSTINGYLAALCNSDLKQFRRFFQVRIVSW